MHLIRAVVTVLGLVGIAAVSPRAMAAALPAEASPAAPSEWTDSLNAEGYPRDVQAILEEARRECLAGEGVRVEFTPKIVRKIDLTGDGRDDYIVDFEHAVCIEREYLFHGTGGSDFIILVARPKGGFVSVFHEHVLAYKVSDGPGPRTMTFYLHRGHCFPAEPPECVKKRRITAKPFRFRDW